MTVKEFYEFVKSCGFEDCPLRVVISDDIDASRIDVSPENTSVYFNEVIIYP
jgi:hypothetical protein